jgi:hypothetical protein
MKRFMFDIETLSTKPTAAVIAVAVAVYDDSRPEHFQARSWFIDRDFVIGNIDPATLEWWDQQHPAVKSRVFGGHQIPKEVYQEMNGFIAANSAGLGDDQIRCYADPSNFDFPILRHQYNECGIVPAWNWRSERCMGSIRKELEDAGFGVLRFEPPEDEKHHPIHDCRYQIKELQALLELISRLKHPAQVAV